MKKSDSTDLVTKAYLDIGLENFESKIDDKLTNFRSDILNGIDKVLVN